MRGAAWSIGADVGSRLLGVVGTLVLTRFLAPEVVGEVAVASVLALTAGMLSNIGFGQYVVAKPKATRSQVFHATFYNLTFAVAGACLIVVFAEPLAPLFDAPGMTQYVPGLALAMFFQRASLTPARVLGRDLRFRVVSLGRATGEIAYTGVSVGLAAAGWGGEAIVWGNIARSVLQLLIYAASVHRPDWLQFGKITRKETRELFGFGAPLAVAGVAATACQWWDNLLFSRLFGPAQMGLYKLAYNLADIPAAHIGEHIGDVLLPSFARMEDGQRRQALVRSTAILGLIVFPLAVGLSAVAPTLTAVLFNEEWQGLAPYLVVLAGLSVVRPVGWTVGSYLISRHAQRAVMTLEVGKLCLLMACIYIFGLAGPVWAATGVGVAFGLHAVASMWMAHATDGIPFGEMVGNMIRPLLACVPLAVAAVGTRLVADSLGFGDTVASLVAQIVAGGVVYVVAALTVAKRTSDDFIGLLRKALKRG